LPIIAKELARDTRFEISELCVTSEGDAPAESLQRLPKLSSLNEVCQISWIQRTSEAIAEGDIILDLSRPGGLDEQRQDEQLPLQFGLPGTVEAGPGAFGAALRAVPHTLRIASIVEAESPNAVLLNAVAPVGITTQATATFTSVDVQGVTAGPYRDIRIIADAFTGEGSEITATDISGLVDAAWYSGVRIDGQPPTQDVFNAAPAEQLSRETRVAFEVAQLTARKHGTPDQWPGLSMSYYREPRQFIEIGHAAGTPAERLSNEREAIEAAIGNDLQSKFPEFYQVTTALSQTLCALLAQHAADDPTPVPAGIVNHGRQPTFENKTVVASNQLERDVSDDTDVAIPTIDEHLLQQLAQFQRQTARAVAASNRSLAREALARNPLVADESLAKQLFDRMEELYGDDRALFRD
jgi:alpha-galactosidase/6-phospho-beta-glucosidase family protein